MAASRHVEVERKYAVAPDTGLPDLTRVDGVCEVRPLEPVDLDAVYVDTAGLDLLHHHVTVRRREGGSDEGWHLKEPAGPDTRAETRLPLDGAARTVPEPLRSAVEHITGGRELVPVAHLTTHRSEHLLLGPDGAGLAVVSDDEVRAERLLPPRLRQHWREWEVELTSAGTDLLEQVEVELLAVGARLAGVSSKVARALVEESPPHRTAPGRADLDPRRSSARDALTAYLLEHLAVLEEHDEGLRGETVHRLRIAARRIRSALTTYGPLFERGAVDDLREELRWVGTALGDARDSEVLRTHLDALTSEDTDETGSGVVRRRILEDLEEAHRVGRAAAVGAVESERYRWLVRAVRAVVDAPALRPAALRPARKVLPDLLEQDARLVRRAAGAARHATPGPDRDRALHEVRKKVKRLRYAAESATPVLGERAETLTRTAQALQDALGAHQDTVTSRVWLEALATRAPGEAEVSFGAGRLHAREEERARRARQDFEEAWTHLPPKHVDRWVRGTRT